MAVIFDSKTQNENFPNVYDIDPKELEAKKTEVALIDVRRPDEFTGELGHVPGSELLTLDQLHGKMDQLPKDKTIVFICRSGGRSGQATAFAQENGLSEVYNMKGGMLLWNEYGLPTSNTK